MEDKLTPQLNESQIRENIDAMQKQGVTNDKVQSYVNNYQKDPSGNYTLKGKSFAGKAWDVTKNVASHIFDAPATMAVRAGQAVGAGVGKVASAVTGDPGYYDRSMEAINQDKSVPFFGSHVKAIDKETPESIVGEGINTASFGIPNPIAAGAVMGGSSGMMNNDSALGVAGKTAIGGLLGWAAQAAGHALFPASATTESILTNAGSAASDSEASQIAGTLADNGIKDITSPTSRAIAHNLLQNSINDVQSKLTQTSTDVISGEATGAQSQLQGYLQNLLRAQDALSQVGSVPAEHATSGLLSRAAGGAIKSVGRFVGRALPTAVGIGAGGLVLKNMMSGSPLLDKLNGGR